MNPIGFEQGPVSGLPGLAALLSGLCGGPTAHCGHWQDRDRLQQRVANPEVAVPRHAAPTGRAGLASFRLKLCCVQPRERLDPRNRTIELLDGFQQRVVVSRLLAASAGTGPRTCTALPARRRKGTWTAIRLWCYAYLVSELHKPPPPKSSPATFNFARIQVRWLATTTSYLKLILSSRPLVLPSRACGDPRASFVVIITWPRRLPIFLLLVCFNTLPFPLRATPTTSSTSLISNRDHGQLHFQVHPAEEVFVTGTFDNWTKSEQLAKEGDVFQKTVYLKDASKKIYFKFVVDGNWTVNESSPKEADHEGNVNNFITPEDILQSDPAAAFISTVAPQSTTAKMASEQPIEKPEGTATPSDVPGGFPVTPNTELDKPIGVNPLPAAVGAVNPIKLEPGEKVPDVGIESTNEHVKLDEESYEKSDAIPGIEATDLPPVTSNLIPESSLPVTAASDVNINTVNVGATTVGLAAQVPLETKVPEVVKESQEKAGVEPEAAAVPEEVADKAKVEEELKETVTEAPATSEGTAGLGTEKSESDYTTAIAAGAATAGAAVVAAAVAAKDTVVETAAPVVNDAAAAAADVANKNLPDTVKEKLPEPVQETLAQQETAAKEETREEVSPEVPAEVKESITESGKSPEAAANTTAVEEKKEVEAELLKEVKPVAAVDEPKAEEPKAEEPKAEETKVEEEVPITSATITDVQAIDSPVTEVTNVEVTKTEVPIAEIKQDVPAIEEPKIEEPKIEEPKVEEPKTEEPQAEVAKTEVPPIDTTVASEAPKSDAPAVDTPVTETDKTEVPPTEAPAEEHAKTDAANGANGTHDDKVSEKKKNRLSSFFNRFRHRFSDKN
ncbi:carbohydrate-binding module family 48 [Trichoderma arundinaceum]|uniref:Carbohydrate-binding module family 48 n=1 Tax=Trichoderma arundinaceum TaxID=490622 RepID=A0A395NAX6_TRIAR|nr:carbohydrate-binding module family 48 [Trichoderma arundinaceum]